MVTLESVRPLEGAIILIVVLLSLGSLAFADTWDPIEDADFSGNQYYGAQLAVAEVMFLPENSEEAELTLLIAITDMKILLMFFQRGG